MLSIVLLTSLAERVPVSMRTSSRCNCIPVQIPANAAQAGAVDAWAIVHGHLHRSFVQRVRVPGIVHVRPAAFVLRIRVWVQDQGSGKHQVQG